MEGGVGELGAARQLRRFWQPHASVARGWGLLLRGGPWTPEGLLLGPPRGAGECGVQPMSWQPNQLMACSLRLLLCRSEAWRPRGAAHPGAHCHAGGGGGGKPGGHRARGGRLRLHRRRQLRRSAGCGCGWLVDLMNESSIVTCMSSMKPSQHSAESMPCELGPAATASMHCTESRAERASEPCCCQIHPQTSDKVFFCLGPRCMPIKSLPLLVFS